ncbi:MAG: hypothetical protein M3010_06350 [Candidatus Dormibacteraeota bacterium]|nr:hypothetical protein [Candidatus Dormibacteraeota bacterium]
MNESHVPGQTTATRQRPAKDFDTAIELLDLTAEGKLLMAEAGDNASHRAAKTLSKTGPFSVVLMAALSGTDIRDHSVHGAAVVQLIKGQAHFEIGETGVDVAVGNAITIAAGVEHRLSVPEDALLLLMIAAS